MNSAPLYNQLAQAPAYGTAHWIETADHVRLRLALWKQGDKGTVLIFPGRTEFIEKYGRTVDDFGQRGYAAAVIDWRGQGLSDRLAPNRDLGHVGQFGDYQCDITALMDELARQNMPRPYYLCAHSMGGTIGLRALVNKIDVRRTVFSAPMWGLTIDPLWRPLVQAMAASTSSVGLGQEFAPGTGPLNYLQSHDYLDNVLTSSEETWNYLASMVKSNPGLEIGGPSIHWVYAALTETRELSATPPPDHEVLCLIGSDEKVVARRDVLEYMEKWPQGHVGIVTGARHEIFMETPEIRKRSMDMVDAFYSG